MVEEIIGIWTKVKMYLPFLNHIPHFVKLVGLILILLILLALFLLNVYNAFLPLFKWMFNKINKKQRNDVLNIRAANHNFDDLINFKNLYNRRILENREVLGPHDIPAEDHIDWLKNSEKLILFRKFKDTLIMATKNNELYGFIDSTYYYKCRLSFLSFLVIDNNIAEARSIRQNEDRITTRLFKSYLNKFSKCQGIVAETEFTKETSSDITNARIRNFRELAKINNCKLWSLWDVPYREPKPSLDPLRQATERNMVLIYIRTQLNHKFDSKENPTKDEIIEILDFVYLNIYYDSYNEREWHKYICELHGDVLLQYDKSTNNPI
jgi:hypothetical protein